MRTLAGHTLQVYVGRDTAFDIELPANSLSGKVRRERTGEPLGGGAVRLRRVGAPVGSGHGPVNAKVTSDGSFRFAGLPEGEYAVRVTQRNFETASRRVRVVGGRASRHPAAQGAHRRSAALTVSTCALTAWLCGPTLPEPCRNAR